MPKRNPYLWEAHCTKPDQIIRQEQSGWRYLKPVKYQCVALIFRPQEVGFKQVSFDFNPDFGFMLQWVGWESSISFCGSRITDHDSTNKIVVRQFLALADNKKRILPRYFDFFYYILPGGNIVVGNTDFDSMCVKMKRFNL